MIYTSCAQDKVGVVLSTSVYIAASSNTPTACRVYYTFAGVSFTFENHPSVDEKLNTSGVFNCSVAWALDADGAPLVPPSNQPQSQIKSARFSTGSHGVVTHIFCTRQQYSVSTQHLAMLCSKFCYHSHSRVMVYGCLKESPETRELCCKYFAVSDDYSATKRLDVIQSIGMSSAADLDKLSKWIEESRLDPNDPTNADLMYLMRVSFRDWITNK